MTHLVSQPEQAGIGTVRAAKPVRHWLRRVGVIFVCFVGISGHTAAAVAILRTPPLLADNFNDGWLDVRLWKVGRRSVMEENGYVRLMNRGLLITQKEFTDPISVDFDWKWIDHAGGAALRG